MDIFDPLVGMGRAISSAELGEKPRGASFVDKLFIPFSGKPSRTLVKITCWVIGTKEYIVAAEAPFARSCIVGDKAHAYLVVTRHQVSLGLQIRV